MEKNYNRLLSLDVFRGITIASMILVNNPGSWQYVYPPLRHASWNGCTPTDLVFPFFLFIVGIAITLSLTKRKEEGVNQVSLIFQIVRRSILIFLIGLFLNGFPDFNFASIRIPGVLQRIALVYLISSIIFLKAEFKIIISLSLFFLLFYWVLVALIPVPGFGNPDLSVSVITDQVTNQKVAPNIAAWLDRMLFGGHLWGATGIWDPEGLLSTIPAISTCLSGVLLGKFLQHNMDNIQKTVWIFISANFLIFTGMIWDISFQFNKNLWTSSYVLFTSGIALNVFAVCYWLADIKKITWWTKPFVIYGTNAIAVYFLSGIFSDLLYMIKIYDTAGNVKSLSGVIYDSLFTPFFSPYVASLAWALVYVLFWLAIMWLFYRKKIFIRI